MSLFKNNSGNRTATIFFTLITVFLFIIRGYIPACAGDVEKANTSAPGNDSVNEWDIVAEVNGKTISTGELLKQYNLYFLMSRFSRTYEKGLTINSYLDNYISELLLLHEADDIGIRVTQDEVENEKNRYLKLFRFASEKILIKWLNSKTLTIEDAGLYFKNSLILRRLCDKKIGIKKISDEEAMEYYKAHDEYYHRTAKIRVSHILICHRQSQGCASSLSKSKAKELAESVKNSVTTENFATLAQRYSFDSTGRSGGSLGDITKGSAAPSFEKAAFSLERGEISDIVETEYGYHIIYVTDKLEELSISFEEARESIDYTLEEEQITSALLKYGEQLQKEAKIKKYTEADRESSVDKSPDKGQKKKSELTIKQYSTFKATGEKIVNKNSKGQPVILLFTRKGCHFCEWVEETFEEVANEYVDKGLIEAHHYDFSTKDDFLTSVIEKDIPQNYENLFEQNNPTKSTPYFNFGNVYYRRGTGYFEQDDLYAEEMEMRQIIDDLLRE
ncbi:MAG: peptidylprolyl isomerase [Desulfobacteraceae bacterium]|jgi:parvulin-like peptidyl-prolyl isomerase